MTKTLSGKDRAMVITSEKYCVICHSHEHNAIDCPKKEKTHGH